MLPLHCVGCSCAMIMLIHSIWHVNVCHSCHITVWGMSVNTLALGQKGHIETVSGVVNPTTGAVQIKALFPNPDRELLSGTIGNVILQGLNTDAILIPMTATVELQDKIIAYRLKNGKSEAAYLTADRLNDGNHFVVKQGLSVGDTIVCEGVGLVREGMIVTPKTVTP